MSVMKYKDPSTGEVKKVFAPTVDTYTKTETYSKTESDTLLAGKAPAGYGLGTNAVPIDDYNNAINNGWYRGGENYPSKIDYANYGMVRVDNIGQIKFQTFYAGDTGSAMTSPFIAIRKSVDYGATWSEWEYVNPPMVIGIVYRTIEKHLGNPVYKKMDSNGVIWWSTDQSTWKREAERVGAAPVTKKASITLSTNWTGDASPYTQSVTISGTTANSKVDLQPDATAIAQMADDGTVALYIANENGTLTVYAVGEKPTVELTIQATITEVSV